MKKNHPKKISLYEPSLEKDACGFGFVCNIKGKPSHSIINDGLTILGRLEHRGGVGECPNSGDGAGMMMQIPHEFFSNELQQQNLQLPKFKEYGVAQIFFPKDTQKITTIKKIIEDALQNYSLKVFHWRVVPTDNSSLGKAPLANEPQIEQLFVIKNQHWDEFELERKLYIIRKIIEHRVANKFQEKLNNDFYICSFSCRKIVYKGQLVTYQIPQYYLDLKNENFKSCFAMVHSRFSTNTFPQWKLAQPFRYLAHNGEINTLSGNKNWLKARYKTFVSDLFSAEELKNILPILEKDISDSGTLDNFVELLTLSGRSLAHTMMMLIPEAWEKQKNMLQQKTDFYRYHSIFLEPWDGPAAISFTDGNVIGGILDRNGLRPSFYSLAKDNTLIMSSESGVLDTPASEILFKKRLQPGKILIIDFDRGEIISDDEVKKDLCNQFDYGNWLQSVLKIEEDENSFDHEITLLKDKHKRVNTLQKLFAYSEEDLSLLITPMVKDAKEGIGSMGTDTPLSVLSSKAQILSDYFHQLFAQVTNPPIDPIREESLMNLIVFLGKQQNILQPTKHHTKNIIQLNTPILSPSIYYQLKKNEQLKQSHFSICYEKSLSLESAVDNLLIEIEQKIKRENLSLIFLNDSKADKNLYVIPALLAVSALHHHLVKKGMRFDVSIILATGEAREVHHFCTLLGYGANAIYPYLVYSSVEIMKEKKLLSSDFPHQEFINNFINAVNKGILKVMSKMGISTVRSYIGSQIFEAVGINQKVIEKYFSGTFSRIGGIGIQEIAQEAKIKYDYAYNEIKKGYEDSLELEEGGKYSWRHGGETHLLRPDVIHKLQHSCKMNNYQMYREYSESINNQSKQLLTIRGLLDFKESDAISLDEVEPIENIMTRFVTGAMSYGSISIEAHTLLAIVMNRIGGKSNTGEGGEDTDRYKPLENGDSKRSAIKQVASGRFGVTNHYLVNADELQIKVAQGAKPGEGGQLPGHKVDEEIARVRHSTPGVGLISPPPHHDIYSIEDLAQLIFDLKNVNDQSEVSVKLVSEVGVGIIAAGVVKANSDRVIIAGFDGGTGASPLTSIKHTGLPWELGLAETHQVLLKNKLRNRAKLQVDGQIRTGKDMAIATLLGAEEWGVSTAALIVEGCIMMRKCHLNTCPVGIATQDKDLRKTFSGEVENVVNLFRFLAMEMREIMAKLGFKTVDEMVGRVDKLKKKESSHWKAKYLEMEKLLSLQTHELEKQYCCMPQFDNLKNAIDYTWVAENLKGMKSKEDMQREIKIVDNIKNINRSAGTIFSSEVTRIINSQQDKSIVNELQENKFHFQLKGTAGQSFAAFGVKGITFELEGEANDYFGKGLSGSQLIVYPPKQSFFNPEENIIVGNVAFYGATSGQAYIRGMAGERFCIRNSGVEVVVDSIGIHGCEYMTGGRIIVLDEIGMNFAAGMSGGIAYIYDKKNIAQKNINMEMVGLEKLIESDEIDYVKYKITKHFELTGGQNSKQILSDWKSNIQHFIKVIPHDYKRVLMAKGKAS